ncbi:MAG: hypothetical protein ICV85_13510 [Tolypothrix sp. T3-bin4]|nr:hypothetical protein [Tolypothrix sp. T3-bin4]
MIKEQRIRAIYAELTSANNHGQAVIDYLKQFGYHCYFFEENGKLYDPLEKTDFQVPDWTNGLFLPSNKM